MSIAFRISFLFSPLVSAARGSISFFAKVILPFSSFTSTCSKVRISGKEFTGSSSARTTRICSLSWSCRKVSISFKHHLDWGYLGVQIVMRKSEFARALFMGSERLSERGSSSTSRKILLMRVFPLFALFLADFGSLKASNFLWRFSAIKLSSSLCL